MPLPVFKSLHHSPPPTPRSRGENLLYVPYSTQDLQEHKVDVFSCGTYTSGSPVQENIFGYFIVSLKESGLKKSLVKSTDVYMTSRNSHHLPELNAV